MVTIFLSVFQVFFLSVSEACFEYFNRFRRILQMLYFDVSKVDRVLHLSSQPSAASSLPASAGLPHDAAAGSFRIGGAAHSSSLVARTSWTPRTSGPGSPGASTSIIKNQAIQHISYFVGAGAFAMGELNQSGANFVIEFNI
jgi:hypothetical protein